jgi:hypothetical protein
VKVRDAIRTVEQDGGPSRLHRGCEHVQRNRGFDRRAIEFHIEGMLLQGEEVPEPTTLAEPAEVG